MDLPPSRSPARERLGELLAAHGEAPPLDLAAALLAADERPGVDADAIVARLDALARGLHVPEGAGLYEGIARLSHHLFVQHGFRGDEEAYDDPANSCLDLVLERRQGLPILLSLLTVEVGRRVGVDLVGVGFPGHFIVAPADPEQAFFLDPFAGGQILRPEHLQAMLQRMAPGVAIGEEHLAHATRPTSSRAILVRMNHNLKASYVRRRDAAGVLRAVLRLQQLEPLQVDHLRDSGLLYAELGAADAAVEDLQRYLALSPDSPQRAALEHLIRELEAGRE